MAEPHDKRLTLPIEEGVLLWCMRAWALERGRPFGAEQRSGDMLDRFGTPGAAPSPKGFMFALRHGAASMIDVQCTCSMRIGRDGRALRDVLGLAQAGRLLPAPDAEVRHYALATQSSAAAWPANATMHRCRSFGCASQFRKTPESGQLWGVGRDGGSFQEWEAERA